MSVVKINNQYVGYSDINNEYVTNPQVECEHEELKDMFEDLFSYCGYYELNYDYDGKHITLNCGYHTPYGGNPQKIDHSWGDFAIESMSNWSNKKRIINNIK
jgi:hypothetical protein